MPAYCSSCGGVFQGPVTVGNVHCRVVGKPSTHCPFCGSAAYMIGGLIRVCDQVALAHSVSNANDPETIVSLLKYAYIQHVSQKSLAEQLLEVDTELGNLASRVNPTFWQSFLILAISQYRSCQHGRREDSRNPLLDQMISSACLVLKDVTRSTTAQSVARNTTI